MITENLSTLKIHKMTQEQYERELAAGRIDETALYLTPDEEIDYALEYHSHFSDDIIFNGPLTVECGGTGCYTIRDTTYTKPRYRASALLSYEEYPETNGVINWVYE